MGYFERARLRASRRRSAWNLLLLPVHWASWGFLWFGTIRALQYLHPISIRRTFHLLAPTNHHSLAQVIRFARPADRMDWSVVSHRQPCNLARSACTSRARRGSHQCPGHGLRFGEPRPSTLLGHSHSCFASTWYSCGQLVGRSPLNKALQLPSACLYPLFIRAGYALLSGPNRGELNVGARAWPS